MKKRFLQKIILMICCTTAVFTIWMVKGYAASVDDLSYSFNSQNKTITITDCEVNAEGELVIPSRIDGYQVTAIGKNAFQNCFALTSIAIPDAVTSIEACAFSGCTGLKTINLPTRITKICYETFMHCISLTEIIIPNNVTQIESLAFYGCDSLTTVHIPPQVVQAGGGIFGLCSSLQSVYAPVSLMNNDNWCNTYKEKVQYYCTVIFVVPEGVLEEGNYHIVEYPFYGETVSALEAREGYLYTYKVDGEPWDITQPITKDTTISATLVKSYTVTYTGDYNASVAVAEGSNVTLPTPPEGYTYRFIKNDEIGTEWDGTNITENIDVTVIIERMICTLTFQFVGTDDLTFNVEYGETFDLANTEEKFEALLPEGHHFIYTVDGEVWDGTDAITKDITVTVATKINTYTVTYTGDYTGAVTAEHGENIILPEAEEGYHYTFITEKGEVWDGKNVTSAMTITVAKAINVYTVTYIGDYSGEVTANHGTDLTLPTAPGGYHYAFRFGNQDFNGKNITQNMTVVVIKNINTYTITYIGDYSGETFANHGADVTLPTAPEGYTYTFTVEGVEWDGKKVTEDITVTVTKVLNIYTITFVGDYQGEITVEHGADATMPIPPEEYVYVFTADNSAWDGKNVTQDVTVTVNKLHDGCSLISAGTLHDIVIDGDTVTALSYYAYMQLSTLEVSEGATAKLYRDSDCTDSVDGITLPRDETPVACYLKITAQSGRSEVYTLQVTRELIEELGSMEFVSSVSGHVTLRMRETIPGKPEVKVLCSLDGKTWQEPRTSYNSVTKLVQAYNLLENTFYWVKVVADYGDVPLAESTTIEIRTNLSDDCDIISVLSPSGAELDNAKRTVYAKVANSFESYRIAVRVSDYATWELYPTVDATTPIENATLTLTAGEEATAYIRVVAQDGYTTKNYKVTIYRQRKSQRPQIIVENGMVTITALEGSHMLYTTDNGTPIPDIVGRVYTKPFEAANGTVIRAIALNPGIEEYSDPVSFEVYDGAYGILETTPAVYGEEGITWSFFVPIECAERGIFCLATYDKRGVLIGATSENIKTNEIQNGFTVTLDLEELPAGYAAFFWDENMKPLCKALKVK